MKHIILIALSLSLFAFSLHATKPDNAEKPDQQKTVQNQSNAHHSDSDTVKSTNNKEKVEKKEAKHSADDDGVEEATGKSNNSDKSDAIRKEAGKGSEAGQQNREAHSRKWWKFWGEEE